MVQTVCLSVNTFLKVLARYSSGTDSRVVHFLVINLDLDANSIFILEIFKSNLEHNFSLLNLITLGSSPV